MKRLTPCLLIAALSLSACEGTLGISLSATPPEDVSAAVLRINGIRLDKQDGSSVQVDIDPALDIDMLSLDRGNVTSLISGKDVGSGDYTGLSLSIEAQTQTLDSYLEDDAGGQTSLILSAGGSTAVSGSFGVRDEEDTQLTVHLDLRSSLLFGRNAADDRQLDPRLRLIESGDAGSISGDVDSTLLSDAGCETLSSEQIGEVIYVFSGNVTPDDLDGVTPEPLTTALLRSSDSRSDYVASFLPAGDYTVAVTCDADLDDPSLDDTITFVISDTVSVSAGSSTTLNFSN